MKVDVPDEPAAPGKTPLTAISGVNANDGWMVLYGWGATSSFGAGTCEGASITDAEPIAAPRFRFPPAPTIALPTRLGKLKSLKSPPNVPAKTVARMGL